MKRIHKYNLRVRRALAGTQQQPLSEPWQMLAEQQQQEGPAVLEPAEFQKQMIGGLGEIKESQKATKTKLTEIDLEFKKTQDEVELIRVAHDDLKKLFLDAQKDRLKRLSGEVRQPNRVSEDCARMLAAYCILDAVKGGKFLDARGKDTAVGLFKDITSLECKAALTSSDIPLPTGYSGDIVELVYQYGQARKWGTVFPLPNGTFKLPKLTTDPTFGLIAGSSTVTEKSPQFTFTTFTAEKFGGLIRLPTEIDEDSIVMLGQFIARYAARNMARVEDHNFFVGTGAASGINGTATGLTLNCVTDSCLWNQAGSTTGGKTKQSDATLADFRSLRGSSGLSGAVLGQAAYYMHPTYEALLVTFNTSATVTPYLAAGPNGPTLDGFPVRWVSEMPAFSTSASVSLGHVLFGDVTFNYLGVRGAMRFDTSLEAGFTTDEILIRALERLTIGKMATTAVAVLVTDAS